MRPLIVFLFLLSLAFNSFSQNDAASLRKQMAKIRQSTNWNDPAAAKKANEQIRELSKKLMLSGPNQGNPTNQPVPDQTEKENIVDEKLDMWGQIMKSAAGGKGADVLLAEPVREEIKEEYKEDEKSKTSSPQMLEEITFLCVDMSSPTVHLVIDQMENYKSIKTLVITGGKNGVPVDLNDLLTKAANYPLKQLYIINFRNFATQIPKSISNFANLDLLALFNNRITKLPSEVNSLASLRILYIDMNPIKILSPDINKLNRLDTLGIVKTGIENPELAKIIQQLPNCKILLK